ncbi:exodeoxyribonuclease III [bacterium]|nr:exodeoxyribonuclease III [bacterium]
MKLISWNVNGIRAICGKGFNDYVRDENPDILCLQETKAEQSQIDLPKEAPHLNSYAAFWNSSKARKGYSGTAIFTRVDPLNVIYDMGIAEHDQEGRVLTLEFKDYYLVNVYTPNSQEELARLKYRVQWDIAFLNFVKNLEKKKPVIFCGDLNVAHTEIDLANPKTNRFNAGFTDEERAGFDNILAANFVDTFRMFNKEPKNYTWWSYRMQARSRNVGWRIDYFCVSGNMQACVKSACIRANVMGSDHCPVGIELKT